MTVSAILKLQKVESLITSQKREIMLHRARSDVYTERILHGLKNHGGWTIEKNLFPNPPANRILSRILNDEKLLNVKSGKRWNAAVLRNKWLQQTTHEYAVYNFVWDVANKRRRISGDMNKQKVAFLAEKGNEKLLEHQNQKTTLKNSRAWLKSFKRRRSL